MALSADGNTAMTGGAFDSAAGAAWVWTRSGDVWTQQGPKLAGATASSQPNQGWSVALSGDGNTAMIGGPFDGTESGAVWVWKRIGGIWSQQGNKLADSDAIAKQEFGSSVSLSQDGKTAIVGANSIFSAKPTIGAAWVFVSGEDPPPAARRRGVKH